MDEKAAKKASRAQAREARKLKENCDEVVRALFQHTGGRDYLWWLLQIGKVGVQPFVPDPHSTAFQCGELNVGQQILAHMLEVDPAGYVRMLQEKVNAERTEPDEPGTDPEPDYPDRTDAD